MKKLFITICAIVMALVALTLAACSGAEIKKLATPGNFRMEGSLLLWVATKNATGYKVYAVDEEYETDEPKFDVRRLTAEGEIKIEVMAIADGYENSDRGLYIFVKELIPTEGLAYTLLEDKSGYEVSIGDAENESEIIIRDEYQGLPVKKIADFGFGEKAESYGPHKSPGYYYDPQSGKNCNTHLTSIKLPKYLEEIGANAFICCTRLTSIEIPEGTISFGDYAFWGNIRLKEMHFPYKNMYLGEGILGMCESLEKVVLPQNVNVIGYRSFEGCSRLSKIELPGALREIDDDAFASCTALTSISLPNRLQRIGNGAFSRSGLKSIVIPESINELGRAIFFGCKELKSVVLPNLIFEQESRWLNGVPKGLKIYFKGERGQLSTSVVGGDYRELVKIYYYVATESDVTDTSKYNYWTYDSEGNIKEIVN